ncbi:MAG: MFS transporter, partial [Novosphingobium sp.]
MDTEVSAADAPPRSLWDSVKPYFEKESLAAFFLGLSSGFPYAMIGDRCCRAEEQGGSEKSRG